MKKLGILAAVTFAVFIAGLVIGFLVFNDNAEVRRLKGEVAKVTKERDDIRQSLTGQLQESTKRLEAEKASLAQQLDGLRTELGGKVQSLQRSLEAANDRIKSETQRLEAEKLRLLEQVKELQQTQISGPQLPALISRLNAVWPAYVGFSLRAMQLKNMVTLARLAPPDVNAISQAAQDILTHTGTYAAESAEVLTHVRLVRQELSKAGMKPELLERRFSPKLEGTVRRLAELAGRITERTASRDIAVDAAKGFTDAPVKIEPGDLLFFFPRKTWQMSPERDPAGASGWEAVPEHLRVEPKLNGGALVFKVGVSNTVLPAYGPMPQKALDAGALRLGINDKKLDDNIGVIEVTVVRVPGNETQEFEAFWEAELAPLLR